MDELGKVEYRLPYTCHKLHQRPFPVPGRGAWRPTGFPGGSVTKAVLGIAPAQGRNGVLQGVGRMPHGLESGGRQEGAG